MGNDESHFNVSLIVRDKVTRQCRQTTTFEEKGEPKPIRTEVPLLSSLVPYRWAQVTDVVVGPETGDNLCSARHSEPARGDNREPVCPWRYLYGILNVRSDLRQGDTYPPNALTSDPDTHVTATAFCGWTLINSMIVSLVEPGSRDSLVVRAPDSSLKGRGFESRQERRENKFQGST